MTASSTRPRPAKQARFRTGGIVALLAVWLGLVGSGVYWLTAYQNHPGAAAESDASWPEQTSIERNADGLTLLLFAHPRCPCTRSTLEELARLLPRCGSRLAAHALFVQPPGCDRDFVERNLWRHAMRIPRLRSHVDVEGREARMFGARTSGQVLLFNQAGHLVFAGGINPSRGHAGFSRGQAIILKWAHASSGRDAPAQDAPAQDETTKDATTKDETTKDETTKDETTKDETERDATARDAGKEVTPVFGCPLLSPNQRYENQK